MSNLKDAIERIRGEFKSGGRGRRWLLAIFGDIRSALVASVFAAAGAFVGTVYAQAQQKDVFTIMLSDTGIGYPALLFDQAKREDKRLQISFSPPSLQHTAVCEYFSAKAQSFREIMDQYLKTYTACFIPVWRDKGVLEIRPNTYTRQLTVRVNRQGQQRFWCKCDPDQIPSR